MAMACAGIPLCCCRGVCELIGDGVYGGGWGGGTVVYSIICERGGGGELEHTPVTGGDGGGGVASRSYHSGGSYIGMWGE